MATTITTAAGLQNMKLDLTEDYVLGNNVDCGGIANFEPVGTSANKFLGSFDGKGYLITGLRINRNATKYVGLFGYCGDIGVAVNIKNVKIRSADITSGYGALGDYGSTGGLVGSARNVIFDSCEVDGDVDGSGSGWNIGVGLLCGYYTYGASITNCSSSGTVKGGLNGLGGLVGYFSSLGKILDSCHSSVTVIGGTCDRCGGLIGYAQTKATNCYATGDVSGTDRVGGLIGYLRNNGAEGCCATGSVVGTADDVGGFVGLHADGTINDCYATGDVEGNDYVGGFAGRNEDVNRCYATGAITHGVGAANVGGFTGYNGEAITLSFWDTESSGEATGAGGGSPQTGITGKTTAQMKNLTTILEAGWSIPGIWNITSGCNSGYPCLVGVNACCATSAVPAVDPTIAPKKVSLELIRNLEMMNNSRSYIGKDGKFVYESRYHR